VRIRAQTTPQVLFNPGPVNLHPAIKAHVFDLELSHRQPQFDELADRVKAGLFSAAGLQAGLHHLSLLHGSGTLAVDAALSSLVRGSVLVVNNGVYCQRIQTTLSRLPGVEIEEHAPGVGRPPRLDELERKVARRTPDWIAVVHHETTTGLLNPLRDLVEIARRHGCRVFVDAVSSFAVHALDADVDVVCFNSNKCLESLPGIAGVFWSRDLVTQPALPILALDAYVRGTPYTPNVTAFVALDIALDLLANEDRPARYRRLAHKVCEAGSLTFEPLLAEPDRSHVLTSFRLAGRDPNELFARALEHGYVIYQGQGRLRDEIFRVANMGFAIDEEVIEDLFRVLGS
jgi:2-aminoethylphosphonate-pyruvate transaminase